MIFKKMILHGNSVILIYIGPEHWKGVNRHARFKKWIKTHANH